jgi:LuxR family transcriptional regulator, maltose regulon positive regulatory protein
MVDEAEPLLGGAELMTLSPSVNGVDTGSLKRHARPRLVAPVDLKDLEPSGQSTRRPTAQLTTSAVVAASKLRVPRSRRPFVPRLALNLRLDEDYGLALVSAPAGYGKTAALSSWASQHVDHLAWLTCDRADAKPSRFMRGLLSAIALRWPGVAEHAFDLLEHDGADTCDVAVALANGLATIGSPGVIVVDDLHLAAPDPAVLMALIEALPHDFRFVAGTRLDPPLPLSRLRLRGDLLELRSHALTFAAAELSEFFALQGLELTDAELSRLQEVTEGWPAGAQLAALALERGVELEGLVHAFARTDHTVSDFLVSETLAGLPRELVEFLTKTSVLDVFDAELCAAVTGNEDSKRLLDHLIASSMFIVSLGESSGSYRYHNLLRGVLRARLASSGTTELHAAHDQACKALEDRGDELGALQQAMAMNDADRAGRLVRSVLRRSTRRPDDGGITLRAIRRWLHEYGEGTIETDPVWVMELLLGLITSSDSDEELVWMERIQAVHPHADGELGALIEMVRAVHHEHLGQPLEAIVRLRDAGEAVGRTRVDEGPLAHLDVLMAGAHLQAGQAPEALVILERAMAHPCGDVVADRVRGPGIAALAAAVEGELTRADHLARHAVHAADQLGLGDLEPGRVLANLAIAEVHLERDDHGTAECLLHRVNETSDGWLRSPLQSLITLHRAKVARVSGDQETADSLLDEIQCRYAQPDAAIRQVIGQEAVAHALRFDPPKAAPLIDELDQDRVNTKVLRVRLALLDHDDRGAAALLADLPPAATLRARVERALLRALSVLSRDVDSANRQLHVALEVGQPERLVRTFVDLVPGVHDLLLACTPAPAQRRYVEDLLAATGRVLPPSRAEAVPALVDPLSPREVVVLRYLGSRLTYREIASVLYVSVNTLKSHVRSIYRKLEVTSRGDAVEAGRSIGLI